MTRELRLIIFALTLLPFSIFSQDIVQYDLTSRTSVYTPLDNGEVVPLPTDLDWTLFEFEYSIDAGFDFEMLGFPASGIRNFLSGTFITVDDVASFPDGSIIPLMLFNAVQFQNRAIISGNDPSLVRSVTVGEPGEQIFKLEISNAGYLIEFDSLGTLDLFNNMQVWIYEGSNCFEVRYGPNNIVDEAFLFQNVAGQVASLTAATVGQLFGGEAGFPYGIFATGDALNPTEFEIIEQVEPLTGISLLPSFPPNGLVYTFCPEGILPPVSAENVLTNLDWTIYPNPVNQSLTLDFKDLDKGIYEIISLDGVLIKSGLARNGQTQVDVANIPNGHYIAKVVTKEGFAVKRFFKTRF